MALLTGLRVRGYRSAGNVRLALGPVTALVGEADSGKSNVLRAVRALLDPEAPLGPEDLRWDGEDAISVEARLEDGRRIAFVVPRVGDSQIYVMNSNGTEVTRLTPAGANMLPTWSPDGQWLAYISAGSGGLGLYVVPVDAVEPRRARRWVAEVAGDLSMLPVFSWGP